MSILDKCEQIGIELRKTNEGKSTLKLFDSIILSNIDSSLFFQMINDHYIRIHFGAAKNAIAILENNIDNKIFGFVIKATLENNIIKEFAQSNVPLAEFTEHLSLLCFRNTVKYELPNNVSITPELIRLSNSLTVECQRLNLIQKVIIESHSNPKFSELSKQLNDMINNNTNAPYSKEDRQVLRRIKLNGFDENLISLLYSFFCIQKYIKCIIYDSFYNQIVEVFQKDITNIKCKTLKNAFLINLKINLTTNMIGNHSGWILKLHNENRTISYGQIFQKKYFFFDKLPTATIKALVFINL